MVCRFGIEIEAFANRKVLYEDVKANRLQIEPYHHGSYGMNPELPHWKFETDSSLQPMDSFKYIEKEVFEAITNVFKAKDWDYIFNEFKQYFTGGKDIEFKEVLAVNRSCGCHIHFSSSTNSHTTFLTYDTVNEIKKRVDEYIKTNHPRVYEAFVDNYQRISHRGEPECPIVKDKLVEYRTRKVEWNMSTLMHSRRGGIEWRAFHIIGINTWKELYDILSNTFRIIDEVFKKYERSQRSEKIDLIIDKKKIQSLYDIVVL